VNAAIDFFFILTCSFIPNGEHREYQAPSGCTNGSIDWNYPKEYIIVNFKMSSQDQYSVCLGENIGGDMFTLYDVSGHSRTSIPTGMSWF
jgi:hypothetical protein